MLLNNVEEGVQSRFNTTYTVSFPEFPNFPLSPSQVVLKQEERSHDILILRYTQQTDFFHKALKTGTPVSVTWKNNNKATGNFKGYVMSYKRTRAAQVNHEIEIRCIGASLPLKDIKSNLWINKTADEIVKDIAKKTKLKAVTTPHSTRFSQISQYGLSYWEMLQELAFKVGYFCWEENATIYFLSVDETIKRNFGSIPLLSFTEEFIPPFYSWTERTLDKFEPVLGDLIENSDQPLRGKKHISAVDPVKPRTFYATATPKGKVRKNPAQVLFDDNSSLDVANSKLVAESATKAKAERARFSIPATFFAQGDPRIKPYNMVEVEGVDEVVDGYWMVSSVTHTFSRDGVYHSDGVVLSDGRGNNVEQQPRNSVNKPVLNLSKVGKASISRPKPARLNTKTNTFNQTKSGYTLSSKKWKA